MADSVAQQESLEAVLKDEIIRMYQDVAENPQAEYHFYHGREAAELFGYDRAWLNRAPAGAVASFARTRGSRVRLRLEAHRQVDVESNRRRMLPKRTV